MTPTTQREVWGIDTGGLRVKVTNRPLLGSSDGVLRVPAGLEVISFDTPDVPADQFVMAVREALSAQGLWGDAEALHGMSICGPVSRVGDQTFCSSMVNRGYHDEFELKGVAALNDALAALLGSRLVGAAAGHGGAVAYITLGTGLGCAVLAWDPINGVLSPQKPELHMPIPAGTRMCACGLGGCAEAAVNEQALWRSAVAAGLPAVTDARGKGIGHEMVRLLGEAQWRETAQGVRQEWMEVLSEVVRDLLVMFDLGQTARREPALIVFGGGLAPLVDGAVVKERLLAGYGPRPFFGEDFRIVTETAQPNLPACVGAAAYALSDLIECSPLEITATAVVGQLA